MSEVRSNVAGVEITGRLSDHQKEFERLIEENGGRYFVIRNIEDVQEIGL